MEALFVRMDVNRDGRLERREVIGKPYLERQLQRNPSRKYLLIEDIRPAAKYPSGLRLQKRFQQADRNFDGQLDPKEVASLPWLQRNFESLDLNGDGGLTMNELWMMQRSLAPRPRSR
jgi:Ca2+-binding EF-hand superfamily protein